MVDPKPLGWKVCQWNRGIRTLMGTDDPRKHGWLQSFGNAGTRYSGVKGAKWRTNGGPGPSRVTLAGLKSENPNPSGSGGPEESGIALGSSDPQYPGPTRGYGRSEPSGQTIVPVEPVNTDPQGDVGAAETRVVAILRERRHPVFSGEKNVC